MKQAWFPIKREVFFLKQRLKYPLEWSHDPRSGLLFIGTGRSVQIDPISFPKEDFMKGYSTYFSEDTMAEVVINTMHRGEQAADQLYQSEPSLSLFNIVTRALTVSLANFIRNWILRKGIREGFEGLVFSTLDSIAVVLGYLRYHEKYIRSGRQLRDH